RPDALGNLATETEVVVAPDAHGSGRTQERDRLVHLLPDTIDVAQHDDLIDTRGTKLFERGPQVVDRLVNVRQDAESHAGASSLSAGASKRRPMGSDSPNICDCSSLSSSVTSSTIATQWTGTSIERSTSSTAC